MVFNIETGLWVDQSGLGNFWWIAKPVNLSLQMPFYFGIIEGGFQKLNFDGQHPLLPDFSAYFIFLGWSVNRPIFGNLSVSFGIRLGNQFMTFEGVREYAQHESELGTGLFGTLEYHAGSKWIIAASARQQRIYTQKNIQLRFITLSIARKFNTPVWLKDILE